MEDQKEISGLKARIKDLEQELSIQSWGIEKTNQALKVLYKEMENKNKELQKLDKLKSDFVNAVSHELRTPLTTIRESIAQVYDGILGDTTPSQREFLSICLEDVDRLRRIIDNLLDISKLESGKIKTKKEEIDLVPLAKGVISAFYQKAKNAELQIKENFPPSGIAMAYADKDNIIQVFTNLIGNALKFTEKGHIEVTVSDKNNYVECSVSDTGVGISQEDLPRIFGKFQQFGRREGPGEKGTGLGLSICKSIIELHNGEIFVESKLNEGSKFTFRIPKFSTLNLFIEQFSEMLKAAAKDGTCLSALIFTIEETGRAIDKDRFNACLREAENSLNQGLRRNIDQAFVSDRKISLALAQTDKAGALIVAQRIQKNIDAYLLKEQLSSDIKASYYIVTYPQDGKTQEAILGRVRDVLNIRER